MLTGTSNKESGPGGPCKNECGAFIWDRQMVK